MTLKEYVQTQAPTLEQLVDWLNQLIKLLREEPTGRKVAITDLQVSRSGHLKIVNSAPAGESRDQIWCLGRLFLQWLAWSKPDRRRRFEQLPSLRLLLDRMTSSQPERRPSNLNLLRSGLSQIQWTEVVCAPSQDLNWLATLNFYRKRLLRSLALFALISLALHWLAPA